MCLGTAGVVEAEQVVGVRVGERDRVDRPHPFAEQLQAHLRRRVDEQVSRGNAIKTLGRVRWLRGSSEPQTRQLQR